MVTPPKLPANDSLSPLMRAVVISSGLLAFGMVVALSLPTLQSGTAPEAAKEAAKPEPVLTAENAVELCQQLFEEHRGCSGSSPSKANWCRATSRRLVRLIDISSGYDLDARMQVVRLLAEYPETRVSHPKRTLYDAVEAAEPDEPGTMKALIELKLSATPQFQDRPGACKLIEAAVSRGDQSMAQRLADCRAN